MAERLLVTSAEAAQFVAFARGRVRTLRAAGFEYITQRYEVEGYRIRVTLHGQDEVIEIQGGTAGYEFWVNDDFRIYPDGIGSQGEVGVRPTDSDGVEIPGEEPSDFAAGHAVALSRKGEAKARYSTNIEPTDDGPQWPVVSPRRLTTLTPSSGTVAEKGWFYTKWSWQDQKLFEHSWWKDNKGAWLMTSAIGTNYGLATNAPQRGPGTTAYSYRSNFLLKMGGDRQTDPLMGDEGFDIKTCSYSRAGGVQVGASRQQGPNVWYRRAAVQTVTLPSGAKRDYVVHSDTHGRFTVWPLGEYQNVQKYQDLYEQNPIAYADLPSSVARVFLPAYPAWVAVPDTSETVATEHWTWQFNKTGTRAATVAHEKVEAWAWVWVKPGETNGALYYLVDGKALMPGAQFNNFYATLGETPGYYDITAPGREADGSFRPDPNGDTWVYMRVREYRLPRSSQSDQAFGRAYMINGVLVACSTETGADSGSPRAWRAVSTPEQYEPAFTYLPGLVEMGIAVSSTNENDPNDFTATLAVLRDEPYSQTKRYRVDAAYYVATPRTTALDAAQGLADDDLLVAEVEVYWRPGQGITDDGPGFPADPVGSNTFRHLIAGCQHAQGGSLLEGIPGPAGTSSGRRFHDHIDEPYLESALTARFRAEGVHAYYTVRRHDSQAIVKRLCLAHNERWEWDGFDILTEFLMAGQDQARSFFQADGTSAPYGGRIFMPRTTMNTGSDAFEIGLARAQMISTERMPATCVTMIDVADLRFLNFITRTYQRAAAVPSSYQRSTIPGTGTVAWQTTGATRRYLSTVYPNHHLRIHGLPARTILYAPDVAELGPDPAANLNTPPDDVVLLPSVPRGTAPCGNEGAALAMQQEFAARLITPSLMPGNSIPAHPGGHWSACLNRTQGGIEFVGDLQPPIATGELISPLQGSTEGGLSWFDVIHVHGRSAETTHKAAFNAAFGQQRDYGHYADPDGIGDDEEFGGFMAGALWIMN